MGLKVKHDDNQMYLNPGSDRENRTTDWPGVRAIWRESNCVGDFWAMIAYNQIRINRTHVTAWVSQQNHPIGSLYEV